MINEISINSNNTIQLSRGELLQWLNQLVDTNITKIQQLGTGAIYCQLLDILYPGKVQLSKVNFKAKNDYQFVNNFKILQQYFTKFSIMKHIEVQKLIKCKYQDNLQFLQWFKKIFDTSYNSKQQIIIDQTLKKSTSQGDNISVISNTQKQKQNKRPTRALNFNSSFSLNQNDKNPTLSDLLTIQLPKNNNSIRTSVSSTSRNYEKGRQNQVSIRSSTDRRNIIQQKLNNLQNGQNQQVKQTYQKDARLSMDLNLKEPYYSPSKYIEKQNFYRVSQDKQTFINEEKQFYLKKFKEIQHVLQIWEGKQNCQKLIDQVRKIIFLTPDVKNWEIDDKTGEINYEKNNITEFENISQFVQNNNEQIHIEINNKISDIILQ